MCSLQLVSVFVCNTTINVNAQSSQFDNTNLSSPGSSRQTLRRSDLNIYDAYQLNCSEVACEKQGVQNQRRHLIFKCVK